jgi:hypothetical protein
MNNCIIAKESLAIKIEGFGNSYFYGLGLNRRICKGVDVLLQTRKVDSR